jgi:hypothetical protein
VWPVLRSMSRIRSHSDAIVAAGLCGLTDALSAFVRRQFADGWRGFNVSPDVNSAPEIDSAVTDPMMRGADGRRPPIIGRTRLDQGSAPSDQMSKSGSLIGKLRCELVRSSGCHQLMVSE